MSDFIPSEKEKLLFLARKSRVNWILSTQDKNDKKQNKNDDCNYEDVNSDDEAIEDTQFGAVQQVFDFLSTILKDKITFDAKTIAAGEKCNKSNISITIIVITFIV